MTAQHEITGDAPIAVYRLYDAAGTLLYVGVTDNPTARFAEHSKVKPWWPAVARKTMAWYDSRTEALEAESLAIAAECPVHNHVGRPKVLGIRGKDRHKRAPLRIRVRESDHMWLLDHAAATGRPVNAVLADALAAYRERHGGPTSEPSESSGPTTEKRSRRAQAQEAPPPPPPPDVVEEAIVPLERKPANCRHPSVRVKGACPDCGEWVRSKR